MLIRDLGETPYLDTLERMRRFTAERVLRRQASRPDRFARPAPRRGGPAAPAGARAPADAVTPADVVTPADPGDEIWLTRHPPVFTLGLDGSTRHLRDAGGIPVVATERGGQVTYHGPGQVLAYLLIDLRKRRIGVRDLVCRIENGVVDCLSGYGIGAVRQRGAPGLYVRQRHLPNGPGPDRPGPTARSGSIPPAGRLRDVAKIASIGLKIAGGFSYHGVALNGRMDLTPFDRIDPCGYPGLRMTDVQTEASTDIPLDLSVLSFRLANALADALER